MKWVIENLFTLLIIAGVLAQLLQAVRNRKEGKGDDAGPEADAPPREFEFDDPELAERTRRIREEIQRKIAERQRGGAPAPEPAPSQWAPEPAAYEEPPILREVVVERAPPPQPVISAPRTRYDAERAAEILEQQAALADRLRQAEEMKAAALRRVAFEQQKASTPATRAKQAARGALLEDLHSPQALRRAFVLREVLGPPVGLR